MILPLEGQGAFACAHNRQAELASSLDVCIATLYSVSVIKSFTHAGLEKFFQTGSKAGIQPAHAAKLRVQLTRLDAATSADQMNVPGYGFHELKGKMKGHFAISVNGNWRLTFKFIDEDAHVVDYADYH